MVSVTGFLAFSLSTDTFAAADSCGHRPLRLWSPQNAETEQLRTLSKQASQQGIDSIVLTGVAPQAGLVPRATSKASGSKPEDSVRRHSPRCGRNGSSGWTRTSNP